MPMEYASADIDVRDGINFYLKFDINLTSDPEGLKQLIQDTGGPVGASNDATNSGNITKFPIQFPPKITADNKTSSWVPMEEMGKDSSGMQLYTQFKKYQGSKDRQLGFELSYIVDGDQWNHKKIRAIAHYAKAAMYINTLSTVGKKMKFPLLIIESLYGAVESKSTWALESVDIKYSANLVNDGNVIGPIRTDINFRCKELSGAGDKKTGDKIANAYAGIVDGAQKQTSAKWY